jgi:cytochrome c-type biogenesis protein CcmH
VEEVAKRLACPVCDGESVYESANPASAAIRQEIKAQVTGGVATDDDIVAYIVQQFGAQTQLVPKATGFESLVWVLPAVAFVCAGVGLFFAFRRWRTNADTVPDDADRALVEAALAEPGPDESGDEGVGDEGDGDEGDGDEGDGDES